MAPQRAARIARYEPGHEAAVRAFNSRLAAGGNGWRFPEASVPDWIPETNGARVYQEFFLFLEDDAVRGGYALKRQDMSLDGVLQRVGTFFLPLSEGAINPAYPLVATRLLRDAMRREPLLCGLGMGGTDTNPARIMRALRWRLQLVPFYFKVRHGARFLREIRYLRRGRAVSALCDLGAASGLGTLAARAADLALTRRTWERGDRAEQVDTCGTWLDDVWSRCAGRYSFVAVRDSDTFNRVYPPATRRAQLLRVSRGDRALGCVVVQDTYRDGPKFFGNMRVGLIADAAAAPEDADAVIGLATRELEQSGHDLMVSNQMHPAWRAALRRAGFVRGPSNFVFAVSPPLAERLRVRDPHWRAMHVNRGDGDFPWPGARIDWEGPPPPSWRPG